MISCVSKLHSELSYVTDSTKIVKIDSIQSKNMNISDFIDDMIYVELENSVEATVVDPQKLVVTDSLIYIQDEQSGLLKCFNKVTGEFRRAVPVKGRAKNEVLEISDFDVDDNYLYILDQPGVKMLLFDHSGNFVKTEPLPFRAQRFKLTEFGYIFNLAPFALDNKTQDDQIAISDRNYKIHNTYFPYRLRMIRTPYFTQGYKDCFMPILGSGIYTQDGDSLVMDYFVEFREEVLQDSHRGSDALKYAVDNDLLYAYNNPICGRQYLLQYYLTSRAVYGNLLIDRRSGRAVLIKDFISETSSSPLGFNFSSIKGYDSSGDAYFGVLKPADLFKIAPKCMTETHTEITNDYYDESNQDDDIGQYVYFLKIKEVEVVDN